MNHTTPDASFHDLLAQVDSVTSSPLPFIGKAVDWALFGVAVGYLVHRKEAGAHRRLGRYALIGAGIGGALGLLNFALGKGISTAAHMIEVPVTRQLHARQPATHQHASQVYYPPSQYDPSYAQYGGW